MRALRRFVNRILSLTSNLRDKDPYAQRLLEEIDSHLEHQTEDNIRNGMTLQEARRHARLKLGSAEAIRESHHAESSLPLLENLLQDLRYSLRVLHKSPAFTVVVSLTLMLGIGANVVVFGVLNAVLLQPLDVSEPQNVYQFRHQAWSKGKLLTTSYPDFEDFKRRTTTFSGLAGINGYSHLTLSWQNATANLSGDEVTGNYFDLLGVQPELGRFFHEAEEHGPDSVPYLVLSDSLWRNKFQADPNIIGTTVELSKHPFTVVGVASAHFHGTERFVWPDYWLPMQNEHQVEGEDSLKSRASIALTVIGRLKPGVTPQQATDNLNAISSELAREYPQTDDGQPLRLIHPGLYGDQGDVIRGFLWSVSLLALLVLTAACANLATLFAARAADRRRELALRIALGASRRRLVSQLLTEAAIVALLGGAVGLATAYLLLRVLSRWQSPYGHLAISLDASVYVAGLALTLLSAILFGAIPTRQVWQSSPLQTMNKSSADAPSSRGIFSSRLALRDLLLGAQITICTLLVTAALVAVRGMILTLHAPLGFVPTGAMLVDFDLKQTQSLPPTGSIADTDPMQVKLKATIDAIQSIPGVTFAGAVNRTPMTGGLHGIPIFAAGTTEFKLNNSLLSAYVFQMSPGYLEAAGTRLLRGRDVSWHDTSKTPNVAIVNETFALKTWGRAQALGQRFIVSGNLTEVVGVAEDGKYHDLEESAQPVVYLPLSQTALGETVFVVRSQRSTREMATQLNQTLSSVAPDAPIEIENWSDSLSGEFFPARAAASALGVMGCLAAMLAVTGIFGMAAYSVSRRMKELGIRAALGASKPQVMTAAIGRPLALLGAGSILGLLAGIALTRLLGQVVYQANPLDPLVLGGAVVTMAFLGAIASAIPARRALAVDPSRLMREE